jgi:Metal binding domain of Ada
MKFPYFKLVLALLMSIGLSAPANDGNTFFAGEAIDATHFSLDHTIGTTLSEKVFVGSIKSDKYHYPSCTWAEKIKPENEIWFSSSQDARNHGYVPCKVCSPP